MTRPTAAGDSRVDEMLEVNREQASYYEREVHGRGGLLTRVWIRARIAQRQIRNELGIDAHILDCHRRWLGDLGDARVLDLGCYDGNGLSVEIAESAGGYLGLDLSESAISRLSAKIAHIPTAEARAGDFLGGDFDHERFDVIYAYSVSHHFKHFDVYLARLRTILRPGGRVITFDPLETSLPVKLARRVYRPFQTDRAWEWPFKRRTFDQIQEYFAITEIQGLLGKSKWALALASLGKDRAAALARRWHQDDLDRANELGPGLWRCMQVAMCWRAPSDAAGRT